MSKLGAAQTVAVLGDDASDAALICATNSACAAASARSHPALPTFSNSARVAALISRARVGVRSRSTLLSVSEISILILDGLAALAPTSNIGELGRDPATFISDWSPILWNNAPSLLSRDRS
ncbi:hypothetical protein [Paracoccus tegillarcae]|uniref:hypothetical protein n=1 Tax=Paracoccus tegillarcae TaxID=1529068 RepID=UPI0013005BFC|nr:hypothetical protein [Paracoccus tegillarcae]